MTSAPDDDPLTGLGLSAAAARLYRSLLDGRNGDAGAEAGPRAGTDARPDARPEDAAPADPVAALTAAGLLDAGTPVDPRIAVPRLIRRRRDALDRAGLLVDELTRAYRGGRRDTAPVAELVEGRDRMVATLRALIDSADREVAVLDTPPYAHVNSVEENEVGSLDRGVRTRVIYAVEVLELARQFESMKQMTRAGEDARVLAEVPFKLALIDGERAILPFASADGPPDAAVLLHPGPAARVAAALFEALWAEAIPLADSDGGAALDPGERELLALLVSGLKDETIARRLDVSVRTVSRRVNRMLDRLGAANRFQAGAQAVRRGWLRM